MTAAGAPIKPRALRAGSRIAPFAPSSPAKPGNIEAGKKELARLGLSVEAQNFMESEGYFAGSAEERAKEFAAALRSSADALIATRGGFGAGYLLQDSLSQTLGAIKPIVGFSDLTALQVYLWQKHEWVSFYGPMLAGGLDDGPDVPGGYDSESFRNALFNADSGWNTGLRGETLLAGSAEGVVLGGAMTLLQTSLGTSWELDTADSILVLEDRAMKPYQIDRLLLHLLQAGKLKDVRGFVLGEFPECEPPAPGSPSVRDVAQRLLIPLGVPIVFGAAVGHTPRPMLTLPLGVRARLVAEGSGTLNILEPAVRP